MWLLRSLGDSDLLDPTTATYPFESTAPLAQRRWSEDVIPACRAINVPNSALASQRTTLDTTGVQCRHPGTQEDGNEHDHESVW